MSDQPARAKEDLFERAERALAAAGADPAEPRRYGFVPGRVELLGKHTDYAGGRSLLVAVERGICMVGARRSDATIVVTDAQAGETVRTAIDPDLEVRSGHWSAYPLTVARRIARDFPGRLGGIDLAFAADLPVAAGLSSSSALVTATWLLCDALRGIGSSGEFRRAIPSRETLADYLGAVENGWPFGALREDHGVGTMGGAEDHTAMLCCRPGRVSRYAFRPVHAEGDAPMAAGHLLAIAVSGIRAEKTGAAKGAYNRAATVAGRLFDLWRSGTGREDPTLGAALVSVPDAVERLREIVRREPAGTDPPPELLLARLEQFAEESEALIPAVFDCFLHGNIAGLGPLVARSQAGAVRALGNQIPETVHLVDSALAKGAVAASAFGAGFGGSVWALVREEEGERFVARWLRDYRQAFPHAAGEANAFLTGAGPAALVW